MRTAATAAVYSRLHNSSVGVVGGIGGGGGGGGICGGGIGSSGCGGGMVHHSQLARSLERILEEAHFSGELILTNRKLKDFPKTGTKFNLSDTVIADLSRNRFCELPEEITTFSFLETLLLYHNTIRSIPESVKHLTSLTYLDLRSNQLASLPREICFLPLQVLLVSNNRLAALPDELGRMDRLTDLDASYNQLGALPARIGELHSLRSFSLRSNQLMYLPRELTCLSLISLDVSNNRIASLPLEIRQMNTLVEFNLENNPLTSPPASLCIRGLVHVFKFLETQATKDEKGSRAGGNYDGYTTLRRAPRHNANGNMLESNRVPRHPVDTGYSTCDGIDKRWSHDMPYVKPKSDSPVRKTPTTPPSSLCSEFMDASLTSSTSTIVDESLSVSAVVVKPLQNESPRREPNNALQSQQQQQHINYAHSSSSNGSSPDQEDLLLDQQQQQQQPNGKVDEKHNKNLGNIQTYREYKEALKQQRNLEISSVYKIKGQKTLYDMSEASNALNSHNVSHDDLGELGLNGMSATLPKSIMKNGSSSSNNSNSNGSLMNGVNGLVNGGGVVNGMTDDSVLIPKKPVQKVIPSRNTDATRNPDAEKSVSYTNGDCLGYVKPSSPMKAANGGSILSNNNKFATISGALKSPVNNTSKLGTTKTHRSVTWNHDIPSEKLSFTMRREFDRQREETELMTQLRSIIETRLKMTLPEDIASALTDGVILCHLANYVRPRSVASIHVPSPGVSKLTMARCRRNVDNFLEACRKIGVDEELICSCADVVPPSVNDDCNNSNSNSNNTSNNCNNGICNVNGYNNNNNNNNNNYYIGNVENIVQPQQQQQHHQSQQEDEQLGQQQQPQQQEQEQRETLPNPSAVLKTVSALIAMDSNPHHQNIKNLQQQHELQIRLQLKQQEQQRQQREHERERERELEREQHEREQEQEQEQLVENEMLQLLDSSAYENARNKVEIKSLIYDQEQKQQQLTATCTKEQMKSQRHNQQEIVAHMEFENSAMHFHAKCHFETNLTNNSNGFQNEIDDDSSVETELVDVVDAKMATVNSKEHQLLQTPKHTRNTVSKFLQRAKLKTYQKMKLNFIAHNGIGSSNGNNNNNHSCSALATTTLQTIVETDHDVLGSGGGNAGIYQLINEKSQHAESADGTIEHQSSNKCKFLQLPHIGKKSTPGIISKRIEFFEHSSTGTGTTTKPNPVLINGANNNDNNAKAKAKNNIFSIYRVADVAAGGVVAAEKPLKPTNAPQSGGGDAASTLLKHDSHVLTVILSCVFIVTFLLLVFFPLPA